MKPGDKSEIEKVAMLYFGEEWRGDGIHCMDALKRGGDC
jgi:hypothetical protein